MLNTQKVVFRPDSNVLVFYYYFYDFLIFAVGVCCK